MQRHRRPVLRLANQHSRLDDRVQNAVTGLFGASRSDQADYLWFTTGFARDLFVFLGASPNTLTDVAGLVPGANANTTLICCRVWNDEYENAKQANLIIASLSHVSTYTPGPGAAITGIVQTMKALNFMYLAETRDTLGIPLYAIDQNPTDPPYCNKDVWAYIVALLDSGFSQLNTAGSVALPINLPAGFGSVCRPRLRAQRRDRSPHSTVRLPERQVWSWRTPLHAARRRRADAQLTGLAEHGRAAAGGQRAHRIRSV